MSKKKRKVIRKSVNKSSRFNQEAFLHDIEAQTRKIVQGMIVPMEQRIDSLFENIQNVKSNVVVSNSLLESKGIITRDEFFAEFQEYQKNEVGVADGSGAMSGAPVFSLYNCGE